MRPQCPICNKRSVAINYIKLGNAHYRSMCDCCARKKAELPLSRPPAWVLSGYKKKPQCERCGFRAKHEEQLNVFHINGNTQDASWTNLKTVCRNCQIDIQKSKMRWAPGRLQPDL